MCTVTYFPLGENDFILTSNRDETPLRKTIPPKKYIENGVALTYPKDQIAGGTWIGMSENNRLVCLLNGGFENHIRKPQYKLSRGVVVKNILSAIDGIAYVENFDFSNIEPFTLVLVDWNIQLKTYELIWDGVHKHFRELPQQPKIWSSSTLYNQEMKENRKKWFDSWLSKQNEFLQHEILAFHQNEDFGTPETSIKMKRSTVETVSVTSVKKEATLLSLEYIDFVKEVNTMQKKVAVQ
ncbi:hypothetical protein DUT90_00505 [Polaribacter sp. WD7]|uniref:NRDE family protein n=1 Tax=Polaribacter sp. WD7 TaxID=2269061 RepID=UPI000DF3F7FC|nr:NRDE family protein [Polaribacter sp. WD7]RCS28441.1 hypothetical protein DUT90_00505 [Polaribacter sp. WD7]